MQLRKFFLFGLIIGAALAACNNQGPIDVSNPIGFKQKSGLFTLQVPKSWTSTQDEVPTESIASFADPTHRAELIGYTGLLDHRLYLHPIRHNAHRAGALSRCRSGASRHIDRWASRRLG
jgi:hypothetical protein